MNAWPPQPGFTLITSSRSISSRYGITASTGVGGLSTRPTPHAERPQLVEQRARVAELDVHDAAVGAGVGEVVEQHAGVVDHEVAVEEQVGVRAQRLHDRRADREVGHEVAVHHVDVQEVGDRARPARPRPPSAAKSADRIDGASLRRTIGRRYSPSLVGVVVRRRTVTPVRAGEDVHAVGAGGLREQERAATVRAPRRARRRRARRSPASAVGRPLVDVDGLGAR